MCGIAGWISAGGPVDPGPVRVMTTSMKHRGPDGEGLESWPEAILGHRRLSIFDLSDLGRQPMCSASRKTAVVFNGAIYNFQELRQELESAGCRFRSRTDTEILLHGYEQWGLDKLLDRIRGMFAVGLWDQEKRTFWLFRDRMGVKPLYYAVGRWGLRFASTARALRSASDGMELDPAAVAEFLQRGFISDERCIWTGVKKLGAAQVIEWRDGQIRSLRDYWQPPVVKHPAPSFEEAVDQTEQLLLAAVRRRLEADVPVGALLSGGIDSSLVCWAIARLGGDISAFTVGTPGDASDETEDARATARHLGIRHEIINVNAHQAPDMDELVEAYGEPFACASALGMLQVSRAVRQQATVLLTGDGGDDVFLGYPEHRACWMAQKLARSLPAAAGPPLAALAGLLPGNLNAARRARTLLMLATRGVAGWQRTQDRFAYYHQHGMLGERLARQAVPERPVQDSLKGARQLVEQFLAHDRHVRFTGEYMTKVDGGTMLHALEARSPFLDQELWEFAGSLPVELRLRNGELKAILRALAQRHLGERVAGGRKRGFTVPVTSWLAGELKPRVEEAFSAESVLGQQGWVRPEAVRAQLAVSAADGAAVPMQLWYLFVLECWLRKEAPAGQ